MTHPGPSERSLGLRRPPCCPYPHPYKGHVLGQHHIGELADIGYLAIPDDIRNQAVVVDAVFVLKNIHGQRADLFRFDP